MVNYYLCILAFSPYMEIIGPDKMLCNLLLAILKPALSDILRNQFSSSSLTLITYCLLLLEILDLLILLNKKVLE